MQPSDTSQSGGAGAPDIRATVTAALEGSFAAGHRPRVEEWLPRFPQLATDPALLLSLVETEYRLRRHYTGLDDTQEYEQRFAAWWPELSTRLAGIRSELLAETLPRIAGYEVQETLGRGGFGRVYRARQMSLRREVAIKVLRTSDADDPQLVQRFISEAAILAHLSHSQVVQVYEAGLTHDKQPFMAMELVEGGNLRRRLAAGPLPAADAARLIQQLAAAVEYLHRQGVIHRDLKPENVLLTAEGTPKVVDFGLARHVEASLRCTQTGDVLGTLLYASPEQLRGESSRVDARSDIYSLGVMLYELLAGHRPYEATQLAGLLEKITQETPAPLRDIPRDLETICAKCLQIVPAARYGSAQELADDLDRYLQGARIVGRRPSRVARLIRSARQHPARLVTAALVTLLVMGMGSYRIWNWLQYERLTVSYFKSGTNRWQVVHGVDPISEAVARTRYSSVRLTRRGRQGPIVRADLVDGFLRPHPLDTLVTASVKGVTDSPDEQIVTVEYPERLESGYITRFVARNRNGEEVWRFLFTDAPYFGYYSRAAGRMDSQSSEPATPLSLGKSLATWVRFSYLPDGSGLETRQEFCDQQLNPQLSNEGVHGIEMAWDSAGRQLETKFLGLSDGRLQEVANRHGFSRITASYDESGDMLGQRFWNRTQLVIPQGQFGAGVDIERFPGKEIRYWANDRGERLAAPGQIAAEERRLGAHGELLQLKFVDGAGQPLRLPGFLASTTFQYDSDGTLRQLRYRDADGRLMLALDNTAGWNATYHEGREVSRVYVGTDEQPRHHVDGNLGWIADYQEGRLRARTYWGYPGTATALRFSYDRHSHPVVVRWLQADQVSLALHDMERIAGWDARFAGDVEVERRYVGLNGRPPCRDVQGHLGWEDLYDGGLWKARLWHADWPGVAYVRGRVAADGVSYSIEYLAADKTSLVDHPDMGFARQEFTVVDGQVTEVKYFDRLEVPLRVVTRITDVEFNSQAYWADIKPGDVLVEYAGARGGQGVLRAAIQRAASQLSGVLLPVVIRRGKSEFGVQVSPGTLGVFLQDDAVGPLMPPEDDPP